MTNTQYIPDDIERRSNIRFTRDTEPPLHLDVFRAKGVLNQSLQPAVIWIHGGGWMSGDRERGVERIFGLVRMGMVGVSIDHRPSQEAIFPAQLHDCKCAVRFLRSHAAEFNIDASRIGAWGASSGGHLASLLAVTSDESTLEGTRGWNEASSRIQAACSWFGPSDLNLMDQFPSGITPLSASMDERSAEGRLVGGHVAQRQELVAMANPIRYIKPNCPPILLMHGAKDNIVPVTSSERFYDALIDQKAPASLHVIKNGHHNAYLWGDHHIRLVEEFFEWHLRQRP